MARTATAPGEAATVLRDGGAYTGQSDIEILEQELAHLARALEAVQRKRHYPLERALYLLLCLIERAGPQSVAGVADGLLLDASTVTRQVDALKQQGMVDCIPNPQDGRSTLVRITKQGLRTMNQMRDMRLGRIALLFADWTEAERSSFATQMVKLNASLRRSL
jgi:DNA-binding MarR family transcriptional regulator